MENCIFCKITKGEAPAEILYEDDKLMVFKDIKPEAPIHLLVVSKKHIDSVASLNELEDKELVSQMIFVAKKVAEDQGLEGYKLVFNVGRKGGQIIDHLHLHLLGGWQ